MGKPGKVKQACDSCHHRKIRCDGTTPCTNCQAARTICTYLAIPKKTGPKGPRRSTKAPRKPVPYYPSLSRSPSQSASTNAATPVSHHDEPLPIRLADTVRLRPPEPDGPLGPFPEVAKDVLLACLDAFLKHKYPVTPILDGAQVKAALPDLRQYSELYGLLTACSAVMILTPELLEFPISSPPPPSGEPRELPTSDFLVSETLRARQYSDWVENPSMTTIQTSFFLFSAYFCHGKDNSAWFHLREAITMLQMLRYHEEETYVTLNEENPVLATYARRMFWVLFITERAYALQRHRILTLHPTIARPSLDSGPEQHILSGFLDLISLFDNFDEEFLNLWNFQSSGTATSPDSLIRLQNVLQAGFQNISTCTESQKADLLVSRQWLKTMVWQLCVTRTLLSSSTPEESMSIAYPVTIARDITRATTVLSPSAFEANGVGIVEKVFDIGCSLADVLSLQPRLAHPVALEVGARDYLMEMVRMVSTIVGGSSRHLEVLAAKANECLGPSVDWAGLGAVEYPQNQHQVWEIDDEEYEKLGEVKADQNPGMVISSGPSSNAPSGMEWNQALINDVTFENP